MPPDPDPAAIFNLEPEHPPRVSFVIVRGADRRFREVQVVRLRRFASREHEAELLKLSQSDSPKKLKADIVVPASNPGSVKNE